MSIESRRAQTAIVKSVRRMLRLGELAVLILYRTLIEWFYVMV